VKKKPNTILNEEKKPNTIPNEEKITNIIISEERKRKESINLGTKPRRGSH